MVVPRCIEQADPDSEKHAVDALLDLCKKEILHAQVDSVDEWVFSTLTLLISPNSDFDELKQIVKERGSPAYHPYALTHVAQAFSLAFRSADRESRENAAGGIANTAWFSRSAALSALKELGNQRPSEPGPFRNAWDSAFEALDAYGGPGQ